MNVGEIASPAARDANFFTELVIVVDQQNLAPALSRHARAHHAGSPCADDDDVKFFVHWLFQLRNRSMTRTAKRMIVHHAGRLHQRIANRGADKRETALL